MCNSSHVAAAPWWPVLSSCFGGLLFHPFLEAYYLILFGLKMSNTVYKSTSPAPPPPAIVGAVRASKSNHLSISHSQLLTLGKRTLRCQLVQTRANTYYG